MSGEVFLLHQGGAVDGPVAALWGGPSARLAKLAEEQLAAQEKGD